MINTKKRSLSFILSLLLALLLVPKPALALEWDPVQMTVPAAILVDTHYDTVLFERNARLQRSPASITKVMTALLVLEAVDRGEVQLTQVITASPLANFDLTKDSSTQNIQTGEEMSVENLLYCMLCPSANEAANILAEATSGTIPAFIERMNARAAELGMNDTQFANPHGLEQQGHYSTAYDMYLMVREAMKSPVFQKIVATEQYTVPATNLSKERKFYNSNALISGRRYPGYTYSYATGVKTGSTGPAGYCLAASASYNERRLISVVLGAQNQATASGNIDRLQFSESRALLRWGITNFSAKKLVSPETLLREVPVRYGKGVAHVIGTPEKAIEALLPKSFTESQVQLDVALAKDSFPAPIKAGAVLGTVRVSYEGKDYGTVDLVAANDVAIAPLRIFSTTVKDILTSIWFWLALLAFFLVVVARYRRALRRSPRGKRKANIQHIDSARALYDNEPKSGGKRPR